MNTIRSDRHIYRELAKIQRAKYDKGDITWEEYEKHYRICAENNARLYRREVERNDAASRGTLGRNEQHPISGRSA